jgi:hypothetical protein
MNVGQGTAQSAEARGFAAMAREVGNQNNAPGFELHGANRVAANHIVHAPPGAARDHVAEARGLFHAANNGIAGRK